MEECGGAKRRKNTRMMRFERGRTQAVSRRWVSGGRALGHEAGGRQGAQDEFPTDQSRPGFARFEVQGPEHPRRI
eukprot:2053993-Pyramimonas_sp.AAC.1